MDDYSLNGIYSDLMRIYNAKKWDMNGIHGGFHGILGYYIKGYSLQYSNHGKSPGNPPGVDGQIRKTLGLSIAITGEYEPSNYMWNGMYGSYMD